MAGVAQGGDNGSVHGRPWWLVPTDAVTMAPGANKCGGAGLAESGLGCCVGLAKPGLG